MAGRGKGRGGGLSLTQEQLQALGVARGEANPSALTPPPLFPKLDVKPLPMVCDAATEYMLVVKDQFIESLNESPAYVKSLTHFDEVERYSDKYKILALNAQHNQLLDCVWSNIPVELKPHSREQRLQRKRKLVPEPELQKRLETLEKQELKENSDDILRSEDVKKENDEEELEEEQEQEEDVDDGTDYANNYFDNGEDYDEEDDNLDDGPVY